MGLIGYKHTPEAIEKIRQTSLGRLHTEITKKMMSERMIGNKRGLGKTQSLESRLKNSLSKLGIKRSEESRKHISEAKKKQLVNGMPEEWKDKIRESHKGLNTWTKGKPWSDARREVQKLFKKKPVIKNGKEYDPNWHDIRKEIYKRDNWHCKECGIKCTIKHNKTLICCHHIDFNIKNNSDINLITLCASCHGKTRFKKIDWIKYYKLKMEKLS